MAYARANRTSASDYNLFIGGQSSRDPFPSEAAAAGKLAGIWGVGYGRYGYMQNTTYPLDPVAPYRRIEAVHWRNLQKALELSLLHQGQPLSDVPPADYFDAGDRVRVHDGSSAPGTWSVATAQADAGRLSSAMTNPASYNYVGPLPMVNPFAGGAVVTYDERTTPWGNGNPNPPLSFSVIVEFASGDHARAFFNAGCEIVVRYTYPTATTGDETLWKDLFENQFGDLAWGRDYFDFRGSRSPNPGSILMPHGYWNASGSTQIVYEETAIMGPGSREWMRVFQRRVSPPNVSGNGDNGKSVDVGWVFFPDGSKPSLAPGVRAEVFVNVSRHLPDTILPVKITISNPMEPAD